MPDSTLWDRHTNEDCKVRSSSWLRRVADGVLELRCPKCRRQLGDISTDYETVATMVICQNCGNAVNSATLMKRGVSLEKVEALETWRQSNLFDRREQAVLDYAEAMTRSDVQVEDEQVERLRSYFDDDGIVELTGLIAFQNMSSKFNSALGVPAQGFCKMPGAEMSGPSRV